MRGRPEQRMAIQRAVIKEPPILDRHDRAQRLRFDRLTTRDDRLPRLITPAVSAVNVTLGIPTSPAGTDTMFRRPGANRPPSTIAVP